MTTEARSPDDTAMARPERDGADLLQALSSAMSRLARIRVDDAASLQRILSGINEAAVELLGIERAAIWHVRDDQKLHCADRFDAATDRHTRGTIVDGAQLAKPDSGMDDHAIAVADLQDVPEPFRKSAELLLSFGLRSCIVARIWMDGAISGFLILSYLTRPHDWTGNDVAVAKAMAALAGKSLEAVARHEAMRSLRQQQSRMLDFAEVSSDCFWETDAEQRFRFFSPGAEYAFGRPPEELLGRSPAEALADGGEGDPDWRDLKATLTARRALHDVDIRLSDPDGKERTLRLNGMPVLTIDGEFLGHRGTAKDMTTSFAGERRLQAHLAGIEQLSLISDDSRIDLNQVFRDTMKLAARSIDGIYPSFWLWDNRQRLLNCVAFYDHIEDRFIDVGVVQFDRINPLMSRPSMRGVSLQEVEDVSNSPRLPPAMAELLHGFGMHSLIDAQLWRDGRYVGVLGIGHAQVGRRWSVTERLIVESLANHVFRCLEAHELQVTRDALNQSEERFRHFAEASSDWFWETGRDHRFSYISDHHRDVTGMRNSDVIGRARWNLHGYDGNDPHWRQHLATLARHRPFRDFRFVVNHPDGRPRHVAVSGKPVFSKDGEFLGYRGTGRDRTREQEAEQAAARNQNLYSAALEASPYALALFDEDDRLAFRNRLYRIGVDDHYGIETLGLTFEELLNLLIDVGHIPEAAGREEEWIRERLERHRNPYGVLRVQRGSNAEFSIEVHERRISGGGTLLTFINTTHYQDNTADLRLSEQRYKDAANSSCDWVWETDSEHRITYVEGLGNLAGVLETSQFIGRTRWEAMVPDDGQFEWRRHLADLEARRPFKDLRVSYPQPEGQIARVSVSGVPCFSAAGRFIGYRGTGKVIRDTGESAHSARDLLELLNPTLDQLPAGVAIVSADERIEYCNPRFRHFCQQLLDLDPVHCAYDTVLERIAERVLRDERFGVDRSRTGTLLQQQHRQKQGYTSLYFGKGSIGFIDLVEFPAPGGRSLICMNDSTREMQRAWDAERSTRLQFFSGPLLRISSIVSEALQAHQSGRPDAARAIATVDATARRLSLLRDMQNQQPQLLELSDWLEQSQHQWHASLPPSIRLELVNDREPLLCWVDPSLLSVAVTELLRNAAEACGSQATITLRIAAPSAAAGPYVRLCILDSGPGIPTTLLSRVREPFVSSHEGNDRGLGLTIVEMFARIAGGYLNADNRAEGGVTTVLGLPTKLPDDTHPAAAAD